MTGTANTTQDCNKGDLYIAIDVAQFRDYEDYLDDVETLVAVIKSTGERVYLPGEVEDQGDSRMTGHHPDAASLMRPSRTRVCRTLRFGMDKRRRRRLWSGLT